MELPKLIETQLESYSLFLQQHVEAGARENKGLEEVFQTLFFIFILSLLARGKKKEFGAKKFSKFYAWQNLVFSQKFYININ